jgi:hypothetical protein
MIRLRHSRATSRPIAAVAPRYTTLTRRLWAVATAVASTALVVTLVAGPIVVRELTRDAAHVPLVGGNPGTALDAAGVLLERATAKGGDGFSFQVVARSTLYAKPGGPKIPIPDATNPSKVVGVADQYYFGASIAEGVVMPDGFWLQMRAGPDKKDAEPDFEKSQVTLAALTRADDMWRNDGDGWYGTDQLPGIGLDPKTVSLLPHLLINAETPTGLGTGVVDGVPVTKIAAEGRVADAPGLMAIDAAPFTVLAAPIDFSLDPQGRLVQLHARMRNTNMEAFDLIVETVITFRYDSPPRLLPEPLPTAPPPAPLPVESVGSALSEPNR